MPWVRKGRNIYKNLGGGHMHLVQHCSSIGNAKAAMRLRKAVEHGFRPSGRRRR